MSSFTHNGKKFINGYACDGHGRPITMINGYSSEDEKYAKEEYLEALKSFKKYSNDSPQAKKYNKKTQIKEKTSEELLEMFEQEYMASRKKSRNGYMLNDAGEEISVENGYTDADEKFTQRQSKLFNF